MSKPVPYLVEVSRPYPGDDLCVMAFRNWSGTDADRDRLSCDALCFFDVPQATSAQDAIGQVLIRVAPPHVPEPTRDPEVLEVFCACDQCRAYRGE